MLNEVAKIVRGLSADAVEKANSGHPGLPLGCAEIGALLYGEVLKDDPNSPDWINRDRFVLSAGHGSMLQYSLLYLSGYDLSLDDLKAFRQVNSKTPGHPEFGHTAGVEATTGPLGQGFANAVGMAIAERVMAEKFNTDKHKVIDHYTYTLMGDGCMMEGITSEASSLAGHLGLGKLIAIYDDNNISIAGSTDLAFTESVGDRYKAYGWHVIENVDGHNIEAVREAIKKGQEEKKQPTLIVARTYIGFGAPTKQGTADVHGAPLGEEDLIGLKKKIGLPLDKSFYVSEEVKDFFDRRRKEKSETYNRWLQVFDEWKRENPDHHEELQVMIHRNTPKGVHDFLDDFGKDGSINDATRASSGKVLSEIAKHLPFIIGGSADLEPSTKTYLKEFGEIQRNHYEGKNIRFGVREHGMAAIGNGLALYGGFRPFVSTFLVFSDYMRPSIRLSALMGVPVIYVFTHDSIYVGEDGPTHQPVEHLEALRIIPNLKVLRPADAEEVALSWKEALVRTSGPTAIILTRQGAPGIQGKAGVKQFSKGGYFIIENDNPDVNLIASGSEVQLAIEVKKRLDEKGIASNIISVPDRPSLEDQSAKYLEQLFGDDKGRHVLIEAGIGHGWYRLLSKDALHFTIENYGLSGPGKDVANELGLDPVKIAATIIKEIGKE